MPARLAALLVAAVMLTGCAPAREPVRPAESTPSVTASASAVAAVLVPVFCYHHVLPKAPNSIAVTPATFEAQLKALQSAGFVAVTPERLDAALSGEATLPAKPVMITFDDGWRNQYTYAAPLLEKYGFTAVFFVYPQLIRPRATVFMSSGEVKELSDAGFSIGSHTWSHAACGASAGSRATPSHGGPSANSTGRSDGSKL